VGGEPTSAATRHDMAFCCRRHIKTLALATCALAAFALLPDVATAGTYPMYQCRDASGSRSPVSAAWTLQPLPGGSLYNTCSSAGTFGIIQTPSGQTGNDGGSVLTLLVPASHANVSIARVVVGLVISPKTGNGYSHGWVRLFGAAQEIDEQLLSDWDTGWIDRLTGPFTGPHSAKGPMGGDFPSGARRLDVITNCFSSCTFSPPQSVQIHQVVLTLREDVPPSIGALGGTLLAGTPRASLQTLRYDAVDADSGVREVTALVDDAPAAHDDLAESCTYLDFSACPTSLRGREMSFDVSRFGVGEHDLAVVARDAAGNVSTQEIGTFNVTGGPTGRGGLNGQNASDRATITAWIGRRRSVTRGYGRRIVVRGRLLNDGGLPIKHANIDVLQRTLLDGAKMRAIRTVRTGTNGRWKISLATRFPSSRLRFGYRSHEADVVNAARTDVTVHVRARVRLTVVRHTVSAFGLIRLRGRVAGAPLPSRGKIVELRARAEGTRRWIQFRTVRTDRRGRFRTDYRLRKGYRNVVYEFEALARTENGYPYATSRSSVQRVRVR
jgi:hypothetical protein